MGRAEHVSVSVWDTYSPCHRTRCPWTESVFAIPRITEAKHLASNFWMYSTNRFFPKFRCFFLEGVKISLDIRLVATDMNSDNLEVSFWFVPTGIIPCLLLLFFNYFIITTTAQDVWTKPFLTSSFACIKHVNVWTTKQGQCPVCSLFRQIVAMVKDFD